MRVSILFVLIISHVFKPIHMAPMFTEKINGDSKIYLKNLQTENDPLKNTNNQEGSGYLGESESSQFSKSTTEDTEIKESSSQSKDFSKEKTIVYSYDQKNYSLDMNFTDLENYIENLIFSNLTNETDDEDFQQNIANKGNSNESSSNVTFAMTEKNNDENSTTEKFQMEEENTSFLKTNEIDDKNKMISDISAQKSILSISFSIPEDNKNQIDILMDKGTHKKRYGEINDTFSHKNFPTNSQNSIFLLFNFGNYFVINTVPGNILSVNSENSSTLGNSFEPKIQNESKINDYSICSTRAPNVDDGKVHVDEHRKKTTETSSTDSTRNYETSNIGTQSTDESNEFSKKKSSEDKKDFSVNQSKFSIMKTRFIDIDDKSNDSDDEDYIILDGSGWYNEEKFEQLKPLEKNWYQKLRMKREL